MFKVMLFKEIRQHVLTFRFGAALITTFVLVIASVFILADDYQRRRDTYSKLAEEAAINLRDCRVPSYLEPVVHYPPSPLGIFAQGKERQLGNTVKINRWEVPSEASGSLMDNLLLAAQPQFDILAVFTIVVSLFGVLFSYDSLSGEKETGTLKYVCSHGPKRGLIFTAKFVAGSLVLCIPICISMLLGLIILQFVHGITFEPLHWLSIVSMIGSGIIYGSVFIALGMLCSSLVRRSSVALILALLLWTTCVIIIPRLSPGVASSLHPLPSPSEIDLLKQTSREELQQEIESQTSEVQSRYSNLGFWGSLGNYQTILRWGTPDAFHIFPEYVRLIEPAQQDRARTIWNLEREHQLEQVRQADYSDWFSLISPSHHLRKIFTVLAGTSFEYYAEFMEYARRYRNDLLNNMKNKGYFGENAIEFVTQVPLDVGISEEKFQERLAQIREGLGEGANWEDVISEEHWDRLPADLIPAFSFEIGKPRFELFLWPLFSLVIALLLVFTLGLVTFLKYDVR